MDQLKTGGILDILFFMQAYERLKNEILVLIYEDMVFVEHVYRTTRIRATVTRLMNQEHQIHTKMAFSTLSHHQIPIPFITSRSICKQTSSEAAT